MGKRQNKFSSVFPRYFAGASAEMPIVQQWSPTLPSAEQDCLRLLTLNIAHGRKDGIHQLVTPNRKIRTNLKRIVDMLAREEAHVVALQECDTRSAWNGNFCHAGHIAEMAGYATSVAGTHVDAPGLTYGTALLTSQPASDFHSSTFDASSFSPKGYVLNAVDFAGQRVDVVSLHLDFMQRTVQISQLQALFDQLAKRKRPAVVMGDFNVDLSRSRKVAALLLGEMGMRAYALDSAELNTFPILRRRLDWILVSREFEFIDYRVLDDHLSDHRAVVAEIRFR